MDSILTFFGENILWFLLIPAAIFFIVAVKHFFPSYKDDNAVEEFAESVIKEKTGIDQDLTPSSPEVTNSSTETPK